MRKRIACILIALLAATASASSVQGKHAKFRVETAHFVVEYSVPESIGSKYATLCERGYARLRKIFPVEAQDPVWHGKCHVYLFASRDEFTRFATQVHGSQKGAQSGGYTRIDRQDPEIVLFLHGRDEITLQQVVVHEMTHVFLQLFHREVQLPLWLHEGFAQYFEFSHYEKVSRKVRARTIAKIMVQREATVPLPQFLVSNFGPQDVASYSQAWSLIDFMTATASRRKKTGDFVLQLKKTLPGADLQSMSHADVETLLRHGGAVSLKLQAAAIHSCFGQSLAEFEAQWKQYVQTQY